MIRFCDQDVYIIDKHCLDRSELLCFFLNDHMTDIVVVCDKTNHFYGMITYKKLLCNNNIDQAIFKQSVKMGESVFLTARQLFSELKQDGESYFMLPVCNTEGELYCFVYDDAVDTSVNQEVYFNIIKGMMADSKKYDLLKIFGKDLKGVCIYDVNEIAYYIYKLLKKYDIPICVSGEKWKMLGIISDDILEEYPEYQKLYLYAEGTGLCREKIKSAQSIRNRSKDTKGILDFVMQLGFEYGRIGIQNMFREVNDIYVCKFPTSASRFERTEAELFFESVTKATWQDILKNTSRFTEVDKKYLVNFMDDDTLESLREEEINGKKEEMFLCWDTDGGIEGVSYESSCLNRIYLIGPCIVGDAFVLPKNSISYYLEQYVHEYNYVVVKIPVPRFMYGEQLKYIKQLPIRKKDIVVFCETDVMLHYLPDDIKIIDMVSLYKNRTKNETWFLDMPMHTNGSGNKATAKYMWDEFLLNTIKERKEITNNHYIQKGELFGTEVINRIKSYTADIKKEVNADAWKNSVNGAIVMNCNPFTKGHRYLIEQAAEQVDKLYIFVVQENKSQFDFRDRIKLVKDGTRDIHNVYVVPSGEFVLSYSTLPVYFQKSEKKESKINATQDIEIFARYIAPELNITYRFVGEEPLDKVTRQYNEQMKDIFPEFGIKLVEIPRFCYQSTIISASFVRKLLKEGQWKEIQELVPESTFKYLRNK